MAARKEDKKIEEQSGLDPDIFQKDEDGQINLFGLLPLKSAEEVEKKASFYLLQEKQKCMISRQSAFCVGGILAGMPISMHRKSYAPFAILGVLGSFVDYSYPYAATCVEISQKYEQALKDERLLEKKNPAV